MFGSIKPKECTKMISETHNIEIKPGSGGQYVRAAGTFGILIQKDTKYAQVKLSSSGQLKL